MHETGRERREGGARQAGRPVVPSARLLAWLALCATCLVARPESAPEAGVALAGMVFWLAVCRAHPRRGRLGGRSNVVFWLLALAAVLALVARSPWGAGTVVLPWVRVLFRTAGCAVLSIGLAQSLTAAELLGGLSAVPMPVGFRRGVEWILWSVPLLLRETENIARATVIRSGSAGPLGVFRLVVALPTVWIPRVVNRADRVASAMVLRGYGGEALAPARAGVAGRDVLLPLTAMLVLLAAVALRLRLL